MKKKILLICKEKNSLSFYNSLEKLSKEFIIDVFFFMPHENEKNENCYFIKLFKENNFVNKIYSTSSLVEEFLIAKKNSIKPNISFLSKIEKNFKDFKNIRMQLNAVQFFSTYFHDRKIYEDVSNNDQLIFYEMYYKKVLQILNDSEPSYIFENDISEFRTIIYELSRQKNIPYILAALSYYKDYYIPNFNLQAKADDWLIENVKNEKNFNHKHFSTPKEFRYKYVAEAKKYFSLTPRVILREIYFFFKTFFYIPNILSTSRSTFVTPRSFSRKILNLKIVLKKIIIKYFVSFDEIDFEDKKCLIFPLSVIPEGSTFTLSPLFLNERSCIELVSNCLPVDYKLVLKEHPVMLGQRSVSFYKEIQKLPNVFFLNPNINYGINELINNSCAVVTISGTVGLEAIMLKKPVILFANTLYSFLDGCYIFKNIKTFKDDLNDILNKNKLRENSSLLNYISTIKKFGKKIDITILNSVNQFTLKQVEKNVINFIEVFKIGIKLNSKYD